MSNIQSDEGYTKNAEVSSTIRSVYNITAVVGFGLASWWMAELLKPQVVDIKDFPISKYQIANFVSFLFNVILHATA
jgi:hypothetical protein